MAVHAWLAVLPWWADIVQGHPGLVVFALGCVIGSALLGLVHLLVRLLVKFSGPEDLLPTDTGPQVIERPAGSMTEAEREAALLALLRHWQADQTAFMDTKVAFALGLTPAQTVGFLHWARGQVRVHEGKKWMCKVARGQHCRWLRFTHLPEIPAEEGPRA